MKNVIKEMIDFTKEVKEETNLFKDINLCLDSFSQVMILSVLIENINEDINQKDIEVVSHLKKSTVSGILNTMEKKNLIIRVVSESDKRVKYIKLTDEALKYFNVVDKRLEEVNRHITSGIESEKLDIFFEILDLMKSNLRG